MAGARVYISNLSSAWTEERQERLLDECVPGWRNLTVIREFPTGRMRKSRATDILPARDSNLLHGSTRSGTTEIIVASLPVLSQDGADFERTMSLLVKRRMVVRALDIGRLIDPAQLDAAREAFQAGRKRASIVARAKAGARVSADKRKAEKDPGIERIRDRWGWPGSEKMARKWGFPGHPYVSTEDLLEIAGCVRNTANSRLGGRELAQARYLRNLRAREKRAEGKKR